MEHQEKIQQAKMPKAYLSREAQAKELERNAVGTTQMSASSIALGGGRKQDYWGSKELKKIDKPAEEDGSGMPKLTPEQVKEMEVLVESCKSFISQREWVKVTENCSRQLELVPESLRAGKFMSQAQHELGKAANASEDWDKAELLLRASLSWKTRNLPSKIHADIASIYTEMAIALAHKGRHHDALQFARDAIDIYDNLPTPQLKKSGETEETMTEADKARSRLQFILRK